MSNGTRRPIYFSLTKDSDILQYIGPLEEKYSFSSIIKDLVRDGIRYRTGLKNTLVPQSNTSLPVNIELKRKEIEDEDLDDLLDNF